MISPNGGGKTSNDSDGNFKGLEENTRGLWVAFESDNVGVGSAVWESPAKRQLVAIKIPITIF
jgi:hypothetical protein